MHTTTTTAQTHSANASSPSASSGRFRKSMGLSALVLFGLAYMVPLAVFTTYGLVTQMTKGHLPTAYLLTLAAMLLTAYSYGRMVQAHPYSGSVYTYTRKAFGTHIGFMAGWTLLLDYIFLPLLSYLLIGIYMSEYFPAIHAWVWVAGSIALVTFLNLIGIESITRVNWILVVVQLVFIVVFVGLSINNLAGQSAPVSLLAPFHHEGFSVPLIMTGAAVLCLSFLGFDAVSTMAEETSNPTFRIPLAIMAVSLIGGLLFLVVSYCAQRVFPEWGAFADPDSASVDVMRRVGGELLVTAFTATYVAGCFASAMVSQASVSRVLFAMGRDGALPGVFGQLVTKKRVPAAAIMLVSILSLIALVITLDTVANMISFGALFAFSAVNLAVVKHYLVDQKLRGTRNYLLYGAIPGLGFLSTLWLWSSLSSLSFTIGLCWMAVGFLCLLGLTRAFRVKLPELQMAE
ncbi:APC family permease [Pseudomonas sp. SWRI59]|uniref:APC family permease n=1 Tax=Pseudomonas TaxID=286 RepID=UPI001645EF5B|nr:MULTISPECIES: APC family permease [unclassified Pseudomonas]MBC3482865.1 APC family permease [Pseudomonas sp. SWRI77]MBC3504468.1 APC family permease [Pseudomonas sp. SWRI59]MBC3509782.1 APC family permease [Pseudomonas sp. SWRI68]UVL05903.1 APC family permease [Pseudomonas sp. B21-047]